MEEESRNKWGERRDWKVVESGGRVYRIHLIIPYTVLYRGTYDFAFRKRYVLQITCDLSTSLRCIFRKFRRNRSFRKRRVVLRTSICKRVLAALGKWFTVNRSKYLCIDKIATKWLYEDIRR